MNVPIWIGIAFCVSQSAMFSGLNLAFFSISKLRLTVEASKGNKHASKVLELRKDSNFLLTTILWGNVGINVLLTLLSNSVMLGFAAFVFSTFVITFLGEIIPQAYFSRHALKMAALLSPALRLYQWLLFPMAKPSALILDSWLGAEAITYYRENDLRELIELHIESSTTDIARMEGRGALNFLAIDDVPVSEEGELLDENSMITLPFENSIPLFPEIRGDASDDFLARVNRSAKKWVVILDPSGEPGMVLDADGFLRDALFEKRPLHPLSCCHRPIIVRDPDVHLGEIIPRLKVDPEQEGDDVIDQDILLLWAEEKRIITGSDILGRLLRGIVR